MSYSMSQASLPVFEIGLAALSGVLDKAASYASAKKIEPAVLVQSRLSPFWRAVSQVIFDLLSLAFCGLLLWQLLRFELSSFRFGDRAPTYLATPLWVPQIAMMLGAAALCFSVARTLAADVARLRATGKTAEGAGEP